MSQYGATGGQLRNKMGHPDLSVGGSRRVREVFSESFWLKVIRLALNSKSSVELEERSYTATICGHRAQPSACRQGFIPFPVRGEVKAKSCICKKKKSRRRVPTTTIDGMNNQELHFKSLGIFNAF